MAEAGDEAGIALDKRIERCKDGVGCAKSLETVKAVYSKLFIERMASKGRYYCCLSIAWGRKHWVYVEKDVPLLTESWGTLVGELEQFASYWVPLIIPFPLALHDRSLLQVL